MVMVASEYGDGFSNSDDDENSYQFDEESLSPPPRFDIGTIIGYHTSDQLKAIFRFGLEEIPKHLPSDWDGHKFPHGIFWRKHHNGEENERQWLTYSAAKEAVYCIPCRLFSSEVPQCRLSKFATDDVWSKDSKWKKLWDRVPAHEKSQDHNDCYITWKTRKATVFFFLKIH